MNNAGNSMLQMELHMREQRDVSRLAVVPKGLLVRRRVNLSPPCPVFLMPAEASYRSMSLAVNLISKIAASGKHLQ